MKISVVTVTYNDLAGLEKTAKSLAEQKTNFEWIVIDGGTLNFNLDLMKRYTFLSRLISEKDNGIYDAMSKGLSLVSGEYVIFMNSGDVFSGINALCTAEKMLNDADVVYFSSNFMANNNTAYIRYARNPNVSVKHSVPGNQQATVYKVSYIRNIGIPCDYKICGDYALAAKIFKFKGVAKNSDYVLSNFYLGGASTVKILKLCHEAYLIQRNVINLPIWYCFISLGRRFVGLCATWLIYKYKLI